MNSRQLKTYSPFTIHYSLFTAFIAIHCSLPSSLFTIHHSLEFKPFLPKQFHTHIHRIAVIEYPGVVLNLLQRNIQS